MAEVFCCRKQVVTLDKDPAFATKIKAYFIVTLRFVPEAASTLRANQRDYTAEFLHLHLLPSPGAGTWKAAESNQFTALFPL